MPEPWCRKISPEQENRLKRAVESTCELCKEYTPVSLLEIHGIPPEKKRAFLTPKECERNILVVCGPCHMLIHQEPVPVHKLRSRIAARPFSVRREILSALGYVPKPVRPPEDQDFAQVYEDTLKDFSGHYR